MFSEKIAMLATGHPWRTLAMAAMLVLLSTAAPGRRKQPEQPPPDPVTAARLRKEELRAQIAIAKLQWPKPPAIPRIQMLAELFADKPAEKIAAPVKKLGWKERLAGLQ